jgi:transcriptional regulator NrdR family protein
MIPCPRCGGTNVTLAESTRKRGPKVVRGVVVRRRVCSDCSQTFHSFEIVVTDRAVAESIMDAVGAA